VSSEDIANSHRNEDQEPKLQSKLKQFFTIPIFGGNQILPKQGTGTGDRVDEVRFIAACDRVGRRNSEKQQERCYEQQ